jgi:hypothetical protein
MSPAQNKGLNQQKNENSSHGNLIPALSSNMYKYEQHSNSRVVETQRSTINSSSNYNHNHNNYNNNNDQRSSERMSIHSNID